MYYRNRRKPADEARAPVHDPGALPTDLAVCLETVTVVERSSDDNGPRVIVQLDGCGGWIHSADETRKQLLRRWPALNDAQLRRALRHISARVRQVAVPLVPTEHRGRGSWALNW
jgi:hypothetical protein